LPLALRIAAERAAARPRTPLAEIVRELSVARLDVLATVDDDEAAAVRAAFSWSYRALPAEAARAFRLLGLHTGPDISISAAAALFDTTTARARWTFDVLTGAHLLEEAAPSRYRFHDLLREYAAECAERDEPAEDRTSAVHHLLAWYLRTAWAAGRLLDRQSFGAEAPVYGRPEDADDSEAPFSTYGQALAWYAAELDNLLAATRQAAQAGEDAIAWQLPHALRWFF